MSRWLGTTALVVFVLMISFVVLVCIQLANGPSSEGDVGVAFFLGAVIVVGLAITLVLGLAAFITGAVARAKAAQESDDTVGGAESRRRSSIGMRLGIIAIVIPATVWVVGNLVFYHSTDQALVSSSPMPQLRLTASTGAFDGSTAHTVKFVVTAPAPISGGLKTTPVVGVQIKVMGIRGGRPIVVPTPPRLTDQDGVAIVRFPAHTQPMDYTVFAEKNGYHIDSVIVTVR